MPELIAIQPEMFPELRDGLLREFNSNLPPEVWQRAFTNRGEAGEPLGYVLRDQGSLVGLLGMISSRRQIDQREERFCNLHTWYVRPEHRSSSLTLLKPLAAMQDVTITDFSATPEVRAISRHLGFTELDRSAIVLPPLPWTRASRQLELQEIDEADDTLLAGLTPAEMAIYRDHRDLDCGQLLIRDDQGYCYVVYSRITHGWLPRILVSCLVHFISDKGRFARHHAAIRAHLMRASRSRCVVIDSRLLAGVQVPRSLRLSAKPKIFRSARLHPDQVDGLYSEQAYFKFSTLPNLKSLLQSAAGKSSGRQMSAYAKG